MHVLARYLALAFASTGWSVADSYVDLTQYGQPIQKIISTTQWEPVGALDIQYPVRYRQILCCDHTPVADMWPCDPGPTGAPFECDPFSSIRRFSPRRNHVVLAVQYAPPGGSTDTYFVVLGGRARFPDEDVPPGFLIGYEERSGQRELTTLMNDAWVMDAGFNGWKLYNPGCFVQNPAFLTYPVQNVGGSGRCT